jgi:MHS family proline/betaine transporter-like MFS transporter
MHPKIKKTLLLRIMAASSIGTILEWYDFSLFAFLTPILAVKFFPQGDSFIGLMLTYTVFAIGFLVRPLGAAIFGHIGDRVGRKKTLIFSILLMSIPTFLIGLLPTYNHVGILAPILLILLRICQGLSAGGESTGATLFVLENNHYKYRGFIGGLLWAIVGVGLLLGSFAAMFVIQNSHYPWLWRVPFILGLLTGIVGYFVRKRTPEPALFQELIDQDTIVKFPLWDGVRAYKKEMLRVMGFFALSAMITYLVFVFMPTYATSVLHMPLADASLISTLGLTGSTLLVPVGGFLSDIIGRKTCFRLGAIGFLLLSYPLYLIISHGTLQSLVIGEMIFVLLAAIFQGTINAGVIEQVPTAVRFSVVAVGYNISYSIFGGTAPIVASYAVKLTGNLAAPGLYLMVGAAIALIATFGMRETSRVPLQ